MSITSSSTFCRTLLTFFWLLLIAASIAMLRPEPIQIRNELVPEEAWFHAAKAFHIAGYALLTALALTGYPKANTKLMLAGMLAHGGLIELIQPHVGRNGSISDVGFDALGILLGLAFSYWMLRPRAPAP
jgi:VanZ family protein